MNGILSQPLFQEESQALSIARADIESRMEKLSALLSCFDDGKPLRHLLDTLSELLVESPGYGDDLVPTLAHLAGRLDEDGIHRWLLTGVRLHPDHPAKLSAYFSLQDPLARYWAEAETGGVSFDRCHKALKLYIRGFGFGEIGFSTSQIGVRNCHGQRTSISDSSLIFPAHFLAMEGAGSGDIYRAAVAHAIAHLRHSRPHQRISRQTPLLLAVLSLIEDARVERLLGRSFPGLHTLWGRFHASQFNSGDLTFASLAARLARALHDPVYQDANHWVNKGRELFEAAASDLTNIEGFTDVGKILANDLGQMRVRFKPQQYMVWPAYRDDNSYLWEFDSDQEETRSEELSVLDEEHSSGQPNLPDAGKALEAQEEEQHAQQRWFYPEWDYRANIARERWVTVTEKYSGWEKIDRGPVWQMPGRGIRLDTTSRVLDRAVRMRRQEDGEELDLNEVIEYRISRQARVTPDPRFYQRPGRRKRRSSIVLLLDFSNSTNDVLEGTFTSILDIEKRAAELASSGIDLGSDRLAIHGFSSDGRHQVYYERIKDFAEPFGVEQQKALASKRAEFSTRIGAALRHAATHLENESTEKRIIFLVSDGEPSDIDVFDENYLVEDAHQAVNALARRGIFVFCLTVDRRADDYMRRIFGVGNYLILDNAAALPQQLVDALRKVASNRL